jgi:hypothetical protein
MLYTLDTQTSCETAYIGKITQTIPEQHTGKHDITELQKTVTLSAAHKLQEVLTWKCKTYFTGDITVHVARIVSAEQMQPCTP